MQIKKHIVKILRPIAKPLVCCIGRGIDPDTESLIDPYASSMLYEFNWLHRLLLPRFFEKINHESESVGHLDELSKTGTLVYICKGLGQLDYNYFNYLCLTNKLPLAKYNDALTMRRWMKWYELKRTSALRYKHYCETGLLPNAALSGHIQGLIKAGQSVLFSLRRINPSEYPNPETNSLVALIKGCRESTKPVYIVPQQFIWDKRPCRARKTLIDIFFGERNDPGAIRRAVMFWRNYRSRAMVRFSQEIDLKKFINDRPKKNDLTIADDLHQELLNTLKVEREVVTGPLLKPRSWIIEEVLEDSSLKDTIYRLAAEHNKDSDDLKGLAAKYINEIAADIRYTFIEFGNLVLSWVFNNLFDRFVIDEEGLKDIRHVAAKGPIVFVPNHRSHIDYLLMTYILYKNNITVPHVAAGLNLSFFPLGNFFRRCGAYFLRRSFEGNQLYKAVFYTYVKTLVQEGYPQEFFIEGGRTRTGKLLKPRLGMLSMLTQAVLEGASDDLHIIPVSISYDRVVEQESFDAELNGEKKKKENFKDLFKLGKYLKGRYGQIYVNFGKPISTKNVSSQFGDGDLNTIKTNTTKHLADLIIHALNKRTVVTPSALIAMTLLTHKHRGILRRNLMEHVGLFKAFLEYKGAEFSGMLSKDFKTAIYKSLLTLSNNKMIRKNIGFDDLFFSTNDDQRAALDYSKNTIMPHFISLSIVAHLALKHYAYNSGGSIKNLKTEYQTLRELMAQDFPFHSVFTVDEHVDFIMAYFIKNHWLKAENDDYIVTKAGLDKLNTFKTILANYIESYYVALDTCTKTEVKKMDEKGLIKAMLKNGENMFLLGQITHPEAISKANLESAVALFKQHELLHEEMELDKKGKRGSSLYTYTPKKQAQSVLKELLEGFLF